MNWLPVQNCASGWYAQAVASLQLALKRQPGDPMRPQALMQTLWASQLARPEHFSTGPPVTTRRRLPGQPDYPLRS